MAKDSRLVQIFLPDLQKDGEPLGRWLFKSMQVVDLMYENVATRATAIRANGVYNAMIHICFDSRVGLLYRLTWIEFVSPPPSER